MKSEQFFVILFVIISLISTFCCVGCVINHGCLGVPKDKAEGTRCFLEPDNALTSPAKRVDCSLNFNKADKVRFQCEKLYKPAGLTAQEEEDQQAEELQNGGDFWRFSKCLGGDEWDSLNSTISLINFRCEMDTGFFDQEEKSALISGGVEVAVKSMPWMAAIFQEEKYSCGGTLIDKTFVLTAAHCTVLDDSVGIGSLPPEQLTVVIGTSSGVYSQATDRQFNPNAQIFKVVQISNHPNYTGAPTYHNDIAILQLEKKVQPTKFALAAAFPKKIQIRSIEKGGFVLQVNGFGIFSNESSASSSKLLATNVTTTNLEYCQLYERTFDPLRQFCALPTSGDQSYSGICKGDSGSGAYIKDGRIGQQRWSIQGLVSFGTSKLFEGCYNVTFFTKVEFYKPWIDEEKKRLEQQFRYGQDAEKPPKVEISYERGMVNLINSTFTIAAPLREASTVRSTVFITCIAPYPIKFVYEDDLHEDLKEDNYFVSYLDFHKPSTYIFKIRAKFGFHSFARHIIYSCESIHEPKRRQVIEYSDDDFDSEEFEYGSITYKLTTQDKSPGQGQGQEQTTMEPGLIVSNEPCKAFFYYEEVYDDVLSFPTYKFHCERVDGAPGIFKQISMRTRAKSLNYFVSSIEQPKNCWRKLRSINRNSTQNNGSRAITEYNLIPFVAQCPRPPRAEIAVEVNGDILTQVDGKIVTDEELAAIHAEDHQSNDFSFLAFYSLPTSFDDRPQIHFEELSRSFSELSSKIRQSMIYIREFGHLHLLNSVVQVACHTSHYWAARSFQFAVQLTNETDLRLLPVNEKAEYDNTLNANIQVAHIRLNDTKIERIWCFGGIANTHDWMNTSRSVRIFENEWDLLEANRQCSAKLKNQEDVTVKSTDEALDDPPNLEIEIIQAGDHDHKNVTQGEPPVVIKRFPRYAADIYLKCEAKYPVQIVQQVYNETNYFVAEGVGVNDFVNKVNYKDRFFEVKAYFFDGTSGTGRIMRCQSRDNPSLQSSLEYSYDKLKEVLYISAVEEQKTKLQVADGVCTRDANRNQVESGKDCEAIFYYEERKDFPFFGFRCLFPFGRPGEVKIHPCHSPAHCLNLYRDKRQPSKCWKSSEDCQDQSCDKPVVPLSHQPFVATCSIGTPGQPGYEETAWGNFAHFSGIHMGDIRNGSRAKLHFGDWSEAKDDEDTLLHMEPFPEQQTLGNTLSVTCRISKYYAYNLIVFAVEKRRNNQQKILSVHKMGYYGRAHLGVPDDGLRFWSETKEIKLDKRKIERIYCFGRSVAGSQWFNVSRPITFKNAN